MERKIVARTEFEKNVGDLFEKFLESSRESDYNAYVDYVSTYRPEPEGIVREFGGYDLWLKGDNYAAICKPGEKPQFEEYSVPYLVKEWNRITGDTMEEDEDFFQTY